MSLENYRKLLTRFCSISNNLMDSDVDTSKLNLKRLKNILDEEIIKEEILMPIINVNYDYKKENFIKNEWSNIYKLDPPEDEYKHLKCIYDYLLDIVNQEVSTMKLCMDFYRKWDKSHHRKFMKEVFGPLCDYIYGELFNKIKKLEKEEELKNMDNKSNITVNVNAPVNGDVIASGRDTTYTKTLSNNDKLNIQELIGVIKSTLENEPISEDIKEDLTDSIDLIEEQLEQEKPKLPRIRNAITNIATAISTGLVTGATLVNNLETFKTAIEKLFGC